ncbi:hypothetical protein MCOR02_004916 [Pyricularia oryzae]|uniref:Uncharacterized protein n=1 Tax=Pyricularia oryzae TaxID=318829 RepID=A0A4P7MU43_PYROR|nr:hypothetical protein MCOR02_004916 [Pyricularia oryzae]KAI6289360.1 hypothetical protein MCOR34_010759 [Pyricularia oryzae]KAI6444803.1 hypothetical protein MCOR17_011096 [Pyricularia oryzae]KAI6550896.1 hypothetical protein MCOR04_011164 [Pyricularia oryzae]KAI6643647.1 hypothetical protein MCOR14_001877 [Pyricularia oryzae]
MQFLNIVLPFLLAGLVSAQAQCFDDLDCLFSGIENAKCAKATNTDLLGYETPPPCLLFTPKILEISADLFHNRSASRTCKGPA